MNRFLLGLDIGTSVTKAAVFSHEGREIAVASKRTRTLSPHPGWFEMEAEEIWASVVDCVRTVIDRAGITGEQIDGLALAAVMIGGWLVGPDGGSIRPGILWNDGRAKTLLDQLTAEEPSLMARLFDSSGQVMQLGCTLPVLAWLVRNEPESVARSSHMLTAKDYVRLKLTDQVATDETDAAIAPGLASGRGFNTSLLPLFGLGACDHLLPEVKRSEALAGHLSPEAAQELGLRAGTPVAIGAGDLPACVIGSGASTPGLACTVLGTTCLNGVLSTQPVFEPRNAGILFTVPGGLWFKTMVNVAGTTNIDFCLDALCPDLKSGPSPYEELAGLANASPPGANGLTYVPYLSQIGIIAPRQEPGARAAFSGLDPTHRRADLVRSVFEGVACSIADCYDRIGQNVDAIRLVGGGAKSRFWAQMIADTTGVPVEVPAGTEFGAKGAALLAGVAVGWYGSVSEACDATFALDRRHEPDVALSDAYRLSYSRYRSVCQASLDGLAPVYR